MKFLNTLLLYARILIFIFCLMTVMQRSIFVGRQGGTGYGTKKAWTWIDALERPMCRRRRKGVELLWFPQWKFRYHKAQRISVL